MFRIPEYVGNNIGNGGKHRFQYNDGVRKNKKVYKRFFHIQLLPWASMYGQIAKVDLFL